MSADTLSRWLKSSSYLKQDLAEALGVTPSIVTHWTSGRRKPSDLNAMRIEDITCGAVPASSWGIRTQSLPLGSRQLMRWMVDNGLNRREAAARLGVSVTLVQRALSGRGASPKFIGAWRAWGRPSAQSNNASDFLHG